MSVLVIDAGTTNFKAAVFSRERPVAKAAGYYPRLRREGPVAELGALSAWEAIRDAARAVVRESRGKCDRIRAVSFSSMGEAMVPVTMDREIVGDSLLSTDQRGDGYLAALEDGVGAERVYRINGNIPAPFYAFGKLMWMRDHRPEVYRRADKFLLWADFLGFMLGADPYTTNSLANRTVLFDINTGDWSDELLAACGIDRAKLGAVTLGGRKAGTVLPSVAADLGLEGEVDIVAGGHDQGCNALGTGCMRAGDMVVGLGTYETYCPTFAKPSSLDDFMRFRLTIEHHVLPDLYVSMMANHSGLMLEWFRRTFMDGGRPDDFAVLEREMPAGPTGLLVLPHFEPPQWPTYMGDTSGAIVGLKSSTTRGDIYKALLESITYYFAENLEPMAEIGIAPEEFVANGGGSRSDAWLQIKADIFGRPFKRLETAEGSLCGAAMLAGVHSGLFASYRDAADRLVAYHGVFEPDMARHRRYREIMGHYGGMLSCLRPLMSAMAAGGGAA